jgi:hypothetical protein
MKTTATELATYWTCPFLHDVACRRKEPLPFGAAGRRFGNVLHAAIAEYERGGGSLDRAFRVLQERGAGLSGEDAQEARAILQWRHERAPGREGRPWLIEGSLRASLGEHRLHVRVDRLDRLDDGMLLAEYKGGRTVNLELVRVQLTLLAAAALDALGSAPKYWELEGLRTRTIVRLPAETDPEKLRRFARGLIDGVAAGDRDPRPFDPDYCRRCPAKAFCPRVTPRPKLLRPAAPETQAQLQLF